MFDFELSLFHVAGFFELFVFPFLCFFSIGSLTLAASRKEGNGSNVGAFFVASAATFMLYGMAIMIGLSEKDIANENIQTINSIQIEASDLNLPLKEYVIDIIDQFPKDHPEGLFESLNTYKFLTDRGAQVRLHKYLTLEEYKVASQYIRHCYPGPEGDAAREYMSTYPVSPHIVSKKLVKAQSLVVDDAIKTDCLNSVSLTFLE